MAKVRRKIKCFLAHYTIYLDLSQNFPIDGVSLAFCAYNYFIVLGNC